MRYLSMQNIGYLMGVARAQENRDAIEVLERYSKTNRRGRRSLAAAHRIRAKRLHRPLYTHPGQW